MPPPLPPPLPPPAYTVQKPPTVQQLGPASGPDADSSGFPEWAAAWWEDNVTSSMRGKAEKSGDRVRWQRRLQRRQALEVEEAYPRGIEGRLRVQQDPVHPFNPTQPQDHEVGLDASWLSQQGDGVTAALSSGTRSGHFGMLTAAAALDHQRHATGQATMQAGSFEAPSFRLEYSKKQHNLLLARQVEHDAAASWDAGSGACQLTSSTSTRCCGNALTVTAMAGTDLTHTDCGVEVVYRPQLPPPPPAPADLLSGGSLPASRGLRRAMLAAVVSLDGIGKQLCLESSHCVADSGATLDAAVESREEAGLAGLFRPQAWSLKLTSPALAGSKTLNFSLRGGGAELAPSASAQLSPGSDACGNGLALGASCGLGAGGRGPALEAEWRSGKEEDWVMDGSRMVSISAELRPDWTSSRANIDVLLTH